MKSNNKTTCQYLKKRNKKTKQTPPKKTKQLQQKTPKKQKKQTGIRRLSVKIILYPYLKSTPCWFLSAISS